MRLLISVAKLQHPFRIHNPYLCGFCSNKIKREVKGLIYLEDIYHSNKIFLPLWKYVHLTTDEEYEASVRYVQGRLKGCGLL